MTKKIVFAVICILVIFSFLIGGLYLNNLAKKADPVDYSTRKEDLMSQQKKLELLVSNLNQTLNNEIALENKLSNSSVQGDLAPPQTPPAPERVTRAS